MTRSGFDRLAPFYHTLEWLAFGQALQRARVAWIDHLGDCRRALLVGEGTGRFIAALTRRLGGAQIDCVDASARMLAIARDRAATHVNFHHAEIREWQPAQHDYDLIVTHFFLDCFDEVQLRRVINKLGALAAAHATWLVSEFAVPASGLRRLHARLWLAVMYRFFRCTTGLEARQLPSFAPLLEEQGFTLRAECTSRFDFITAQHWQR